MRQCSSKSRLIAHIIAAKSSILNKLATTGYAFRIDGTGWLRPGEHRRLMLFAAPAVRSAMAQRLGRDAFASMTSLPSQSQKASRWRSPPLRQQFHARVINNSITHRYRKASAIMLHARPCRSETGLITFTPVTIYCLKYTYVSPENKYFRAVVRYRRSIVAH